MEIELLSEYIQLSRTLNFTKTALTLNISQPALSNHIMKIEKEVGASLIDRSSGKSRFTIAGREFLECAVEITSIYNKFKTRCSLGEVSDSNHFVVQVLQHADTITFHLLNRIRSFKEVHPGVVVDISESLAFDAVENIRKGIVDCGFYAIRRHEPRIEEGLIAVPLHEEEFVVWLDVDSPLFKAETLSPRDLAGSTVPVWVGSSANDFENTYTELFEDYDTEVEYSPRYCTSREDFFLNRIRPKDVVILTMGSEAISSIGVRNERGLRGFNPPVYVDAYIVFRDESHCPALESFREFLVENYNR
ncbi:MAG: LysR family transcriptional regulator [Coriobacteriales bacterium]|jgi:DNA-binding transcriptional LysR family regulator|nr:LysR family transcriptional regulator [Coriobacteriales bacterium]